MTVDSHAPAPSSGATMASLSLATLLAALGTSIANVSLPTVAKVYGAAFQDVQWIVIAYLLAITTMIVSVGRLGDLMGRRRLLLTGVALFTGASVLCGLAPTLGVLIAARAVQGLGAAFMMALTLVFVAETVPKERTGSAMGLLGTMSAIGTALGPSLGGILIAWVGWRSIYVINLPLGLLTLLLAARTLPADHPKPASARPRFDGLGTVLLAATLAAFTLAMTLGRGHFGLWNAGLLLAAAAGVGLFTVAESKAPAPLIRLAILRHPVLSAGLALNTLVTTVVMATLVVGPFYLAGALGLDAARVGLVMSTGPIVAALVGVPAGRIVDRFGSFTATMAGLVSMVTGSSLLPLVPAAFGVAGYVAPLSLITGGYALVQAANNTAVMAAIQPDQRGVMSGMLNLSRNLGLIAGASVMGALFALGSGTREVTAASPTAVAAGMHLTFAVAAALIVLALAIARASRMQPLPMLSDSLER